MYKALCTRLTITNANLTKAFPANLLVMNFPTAETSTEGHTIIPDSHFLKWLSYRNIHICIPVMQRNSRFLDIADASSPKNLTVFFILKPTPFPKFLRKLIHYFVSDPDNKQTNKQRGKLPSIVADCTTERISRSARDSSDWHPNCFPPVGSLH